MPKDLEHYANYTEPMGRKPNTPRRKPFGAWLLYLRHQADLSQQEVVIALHKETGHYIGTGQLARWERNGITPRWFLIPALCNIYGITLDEFFRVSQGIRGTYALTGSWKNPNHPCGPPKDDHRSVL